MNVFSSVCPEGQQKISPRALCVAQCNALGLAPCQNQGALQPMPCITSLYVNAANVSGCQSEVGAWVTEGFNTEFQVENRCGLPKYKQRQGLAMYHILESQFQA